jgi:hypothetical protein
LHASFRNIFKNICFIKELYIGSFTQTPIFPINFFKFTNFLSSKFPYLAKKS